jgi:hypothetical protein
MAQSEPPERTFIVDELGTSDSLLAAPVQQPPPLVDPRPALLNTHEMTWVEFERLVVEIARNVDGLRHVGRWGGPGQAQHGLDVVGQQADDSWAGYQAKQVEHFNERALSKAVQKFATDRRPLGIKRLVVCTSIEATRHQLREKLAELIRGYPELDLQLYDRETISAKLRDRPDIVSRFFGDATAARFCTSISDDTPAISAPDMDRVSRADALMRGPIEAIEGLADTVARAEALGASEPSQAATLLEGVAAVLEDRKFRLHADATRLKAAEMLEAAGETGESALVLIRLLEKMVMAGDTTNTQVVHRLHRILDTGTIPAAVKTHGVAALALHQSTIHPFDDLGQLATSVDALASNSDNSLPLYVQGLGEAAIASEQHQLVVDRADIFRQASAMAGASHVGIRLRLALAEASQDWRDLVERARRRQLTPPLNALVLARYARHLTLTGVADEAASYWWDAVNAGALAGLGEDTAGWLYAVRQSVSHYGPLTEDFETHPLAQAMRASGGDRLIATVRNHREDALAALRDGKLPRATQAARRSLRDAVTAAHLLSEHLAIDLLADAYLSSGEVERAAHLLVRIGESKRLETLIGDSDDLYVDFRDFLSRPAPWQRAAAYKGIAAEADLVPDDHVDHIFDTVLIDFEQSVAGRVRESGFTPSVHTSALDVLSHLAERAKREPLERLLQILAPLAPREPNHYRFTDESHVRVLSGVLWSQPELQEAAFAQISIMLAANDHVSDQVADIAGEAIENRAPALIDRLRELSSTSAAAARLVIWLEKSLPDTAMARQALQALTAPWQDPPNVISGVGGLAEKATLVRTLPEADRDEAAAALLRRARDRGQIASNRNKALNALRVLSDVTSEDTRREIFASALDFAGGGEDGSANDDTLAGPAHPLSLFRISLGGPSLVAAGLKLAAATATAEGAAEVEGLAVGLLNSSDERLVRAAALALAWLPDHPQALGAGILAIHPDQAVRSLAAIRWTRQEPHDQDLGLRLARDPDPEVRRALAHALTLRSADDAALTQIRSTLLADPRFSIRRLAAGGRE